MVTAAAVEMVIVASFCWQFGGLMSNEGDAMSKNWFLEEERWEMNLRKRNRYENWRFI